MKDNILTEKSIDFAARIMNLYKFLMDKKEFTVSKQVIRSGTSIGANINEANYAQSSADFISKLHIALKECAETEYWIKLLHKAEYVSDSQKDSLLLDCIEIKKILIASINTAKNNNLK